MNNSKQRKEKFQRKIGKAASVKEMFDIIDAHYQVEQNFRPADGLTIKQFVHHFIKLAKLEERETPKLWVSQRAKQSKMFDQ